MSNNRGEKNVLLLLLNRERYPKSSPYRANKILRNLILAENRTYYNMWWEKSLKPIIYEGGHFYFNNYNVCTTLYGKNCRPCFSHSFKQTSAMRKIIDAITYTSPVYKTIKQSVDNPLENIPLSRYIIYITKDDWLCQHKWENGSLMNEIYIKPYNENISFLHCDWNSYSEQFVLNSVLNPKGTKKSNNVVTILAVFTVYPLEFHAMFEIKRSAFGRNCQHVNVSDQMMILGMGQHGVHMYNFKDVLNEGNLQPYRIGEQYGSEGKVGVFPTGLPFNLIVNSAPPLLFNVQCHDQIVHFGGYPLHYIYLKKTRDEALFTVKNVSQSREAKNGSIMSSVWLCDNGHTVTFHPDGSGRILHTTTHNIHCYKLFNTSGASELKELYTMGFSALSTKTDIFSSFGRKYSKIYPVASVSDQYILAADYEDELELFAILGISPKNSKSVGFVKLYDNLTGAEVKCINLKKYLCDTNHYSLDIDLDSIIIIEKDLQRNFSVFLYQLYPLSPIVYRSITDSD
ncbi:DDB1- and CUL4-associated factor 17 [Parasteatoda tepidariorum]|uniref:DDB1- and CUL4-associated factor 17 n=1 Tax=Parasteatoda tepidariorum TaxID=114398 RepID=UPI00077F8905|nr:DDB1- and CUL4-associated factor 17 [Parasteatoda tepidariorum]